MVACLFLLGDICIGMLGLFVGIYRNIAFVSMVHLFCMYGGGILTL